MSSHQGTRQGTSTDQSDPQGTVIGPFFFVLEEEGGGLHRYASTIKSVGGSNARVGGLSKSEVVDR